MEIVIGLTAISVAILIGLGALGVGIGMGLLGRPVPRRRRAPAGARADAADADVPRGRVARRGRDDRRRYRAVLRVRQPVHRPAAVGRRLTLSAPAPSRLRARTLGEIRVDFNLTLIGQTIAMLVFVWFCMKYIWPVIMGAIEARQTEIADGLAAAEQGQSALANAKVEADKILAAAREQARGIIDQAKLARQRHRRARRRATARPSASASSTARAPRSTSRSTARATSCAARSRRSRSPAQRRCWRARSMPTRTATCSSQLASEL